MQAKNERKTEKEKAVGSHDEGVQVAWIRYDKQRPSKIRIRFLRGCDSRRITGSGRRRSDVLTGVRVTFEALEGANRER
jgi:hypothetical protein